jgi:lysylphosphatidylglycerol synthetase-like protein (DUF2156 family)
MSTHMVGMPDSTFVISSIVCILVLIAVLELSRTWVTSNTLRRQFMGLVGCIAAGWTLIVACWWLVAWYVASGSYEQIYGSEFHYVGRTYLHWSLLTAAISLAITMLVWRWFDQFNQDEEFESERESLSSR